MREAIAERRLLALPLSALLVAVLGALVAVQPKLAVGTVAFGLVCLLVWRTPTAALLTAVFLTALVPYTLQKHLGFHGSGPGFLASDVVLLLGLARAALIVPWMPLDRRRVLVGVGLVLFLVVSTLQLLHGLAAGRAASDVGNEYRHLLGFGAFFLALPVLENARQRTRLVKWLLAIAFVLGCWGIAQWVLQLGYSELTGGDIGVRQGVRLTSGGKGQVQGGLYAFPVAIVLVYATIVSGTVRTLRHRLFLWATLVVNVAGCLLTYERTFWVATAAGIVWVTMKATGTQRLKVILAAPVVILVALVAASAVAPAELETARQRLVSLGQYSSDNSVRYRVVESRHVMAEIRQHPLAGSGLAATIYWGRPYEQVLPSTFVFSHNGYLWLAWKIGIPFAVLLFALIGYAVLARGPTPDARTKALRDGAQGSLLALLLVSMTFPTVNALPITVVMGVLIALAVHPYGREAAAEA